MKPPPDGTGWAADPSKIRGAWPAGTAALWLTGGTLGGRKRVNTSATGLCPVLRACRPPGRDVQCRREGGQTQLPSGEVLRKEIGQDGQRSFRCLQGQRGACSRHVDPVRLLGGSPRRVPLLAGPFQEVPQGGLPC
jgi:hypothetical protein